MWRSEARKEKVSATRGLHPKMEGIRHQGAAKDQYPGRPSSGIEGSGEDGISKATEEQFDDADQPPGSTNAKWNWSQVEDHSKEAQPRKAKYTPEVGMEIAAQIHRVMGRESYSNDRIEEYWRHQQGRSADAPCGGAGDCGEDRSPGSSGELCHGGNGCPASDEDPPSKGSRKGDPTTVSLRDSKANALSEGAMNTKTDARPLEEIEVVAENNTNGTKGTIRKEPSKHANDDIQNKVAKGPTDKVDFNRVEDAVSKEASSVEIISNTGNNFSKGNNKVETIKSNKQNTTKLSKSGGQMVNGGSKLEKVNLSVNDIQDNNNTAANIPATESARADAESDAEMETSQNREDLEDGDGDSSSYLSAEAGGDIDMDNTSQMENSSGAYAASYPEVDALAFVSQDHDEIGNANAAGHKINSTAAGTPLSNPASLAGHSTAHTAKDSGSPPPNSTLHGERAPGSPVGATGEPVIKTTAGGSPNDTPSLNGPGRIQQSVRLANQNGDGADCGDGGYGSGGDGDGDGHHGASNAGGAGGGGGGSRQPAVDRGGTEVRGHAGGGQGDSNGQSGGAADGANGLATGYGDCTGEAGSKDLDAPVKSCNESCRTGKTTQSRPLSALAEPWYPRNYRSMYAQSNFPLDKI